MFVKENPKRKNISTFYTKISHNDYKNLTWELVYWVCFNSVAKNFKICMFFRLNISGFYQIIIKNQTKSNSGKRSIHEERKSDNWFSNKIKLKDNEQLSLSLTLSHSLCVSVSLSLSVPLSLSLSLSLYLSLFSLSVSLSLSLSLSVLGLPDKYFKHKNIFKIRHHWYFPRSFLRFSVPFKTFWTFY